jgi:diguanylate cyclase (GGDEF)-like protein
MDSNLGLLFQLNAAFLITVFSLVLRRSLKLTALKYWTVAWLGLSFALICLRLAFSYQDLGTLLFTYYFLGEYIFGFMLVAGSKSLDGKTKLTARAELLVVPFVFIAIILPLAASDFNEVYPFHALIMSGFFAAAFFAINNVRLDTVGWKLMRLALGFLVVNFVLNFLLFSGRGTYPVTTVLLTFSPIVDMVLQTALGCGMVIVLLEKVLSEYRQTNEKLRDAHRRLETIVHTDPLTAAFNRHAFYGFVNNNNDGDVSGCVGFLDIDDLKEINDRHGHAAGDAVIRSVVRAIREVIRAEDLIFRWGGDEFFVLMVGMNSEMAERRVSRLEDSLRCTSIGNLPEPVDVGVSWGFKDFSAIGELEQAIAEADAAMYRNKRERKQTTKFQEYYLPTQVREQKTVNP